MSQAIKPSFHVFQDIDGQPLENGNIYVGIAGQSPIAQANRVQVYWDADLTIPATQPIRTISGYPMRSGSPSMFFVAEDDYSLQVSDRSNSSIYAKLSGNAVDSGVVAFTSAGTGSVSRAVSSKISDVVSVKDFGAVGDGVTDDTAEVTAADIYAESINATLSFPAGDYLIVSTYSFLSNVSMDGGAIYSASRMTFTRGFTSKPYWSLKTQFAGIVGKVDVRWCGALGDGSGDTPTDTGDDISSAAWNTWENTLFKTSLAWSPYGGGSFTAPTGRTVPFLNTDSWDYIGANLACWSNGRGTTYFPAGSYVINVADTTFTANRGIILMRGLEQSLIGDGKYITSIETVENNAFFAANNVGSQNTYCIINLYRTGGAPTSIRDFSLIGPLGYATTNLNLTLINCYNINGVDFSNLWLSVGSRGIYAETNSGDSHMSNCTSEYLFNATLYTDATSEINVDFCNFWASGDLTLQTGITALGLCHVTNTRFIEFTGYSVNAAYGIMSGCLVSSLIAENIAVQFDGNAVITGNYFDIDADGYAVQVGENSSITGNYFKQESNHPCLNCGDGTASSATNLVISGNTFIKTNAAAEVQNYSVTAYESGVGYTTGATASMFLTSNTFQGRALTTIGTASIKSNIFSGVFTA